ncbi:MAG: transporter substrate-binding domain-containing protein [Oleiphilaceae bacterium]|nr:transporter substrate-binding domain-containing protein [Oleiphilaceae bacterium]
MFFQRLIIFVALVVAPVASHCEQSETLEFGVSFSIPPWVIKDTDSGIELDILKEAFADSSYRIRPVYVPFALAFKLYEAGKLDGVINAKEGVFEEGFLSKPVVTFQNVAVSLKRKAFPEKFNIDFMSDKFVVAFQRARDLLGPKFSAMANSNPDYQEIAKQSLQINLLFVRDTDFIVMDRSIFGYYWHHALANYQDSKGRYNFNQEVQLHYVFEPSPYRFLFKSEAIRDQFDKALEQMREDGRYDQILTKYDHLTRLYSAAR